MIKKIIFTVLVTISCHSLFAISEVSKIAEKIYLGTYKVDSYKKIQEIIYACDADKKSGNKITAKEKKVCTDVINKEIKAKSSYDNYIKSCAFRKISNDAEIKKTYYDQYVVDFLSKRGELSLLESRDPADIKKLNYYIERTKNAFQQQCKNAIKYELFYNEYLLTGKEIPTFS